jgi:outer membrane protein OmpA-like peptidoglycan-associated protein
MMKKIYALVLIMGFSIVFVYAQQQDYDWRIGVSGGYTNYYGDLSPYKVKGLTTARPFYHMLYFNENYFDRLSYRVSLERQVNPTIGFEIHYGFYEFGMSDRYVQRDGTLYTANPNWTRGLNFQNRSQDIGLSFVFKADNDRLLSSESFLAPYFSLGAGMLLYDVWGDLLNDFGQRYNHLQSGQIHNGIFETHLPPLQTEGVGYNLTTFYTSLGLGIRFRFASGVEIFAQSNLMYTFSDYLDDVSGTYLDTYESNFQEYAARPGTNTIDPQSPNRGDPNSANDWIIYHGIGLKLNFGKNRKNFSAPRLSTFYPDYSAPASDQVTDTAEAAEETASARGNTYTYNIFNIGETQKLDSLIYKTQIQEWRQEIQQRENSLLAGNIRRSELKNLEEQYINQNEALRADNNLTQEERDRLIEEGRGPSRAVSYSLDSIKRSEEQVKAEIDSLNKQIQEYRPQKQQSIYLLPNNDTLPIGNPAQSLVPSEDTVPSERTWRQTRDGIQDTNENLNSNDTANFRRLEQQQQLQPIIQPLGTTAQANNYQQQIAQMNRENRYLRNERDRLIYTMYGQQNMNQRSRQAPVGYGSTPVATLPSQEAERRRRWWPFAAAGGAIAAGALANQNAEGVPVSPSPRQLPDSLQQRIDKTALAVTSAQLGLPVSTGINIQSPPTAPQVEFRDSVVYRTDTLFVEKEIEKLVYPTKANIFFEVNQQQANPEELAKLRDLVDAAKQDESKQLVLTAYTDNTGNVMYNLKLAEQRVDSVKDALIELFDLTPDKIRIELGGQVIRGTQRRANDQDRRVEVRLDKRE